VEPWVEVLRCLNGLRVLERMRVAHLGRKRGVVELEEGEENNWGQDTLAVDDAATFLKVRDKVREIFLPTTRERIAGTIAAGAAAAPLTMLESVPVIQWMSAVGERNLGMSEGERSVLQEEVLHELHDTAQTVPTRWSISQAITALARRTERPERRHELEALGWTVLTDETEKLLKVAARSLN
jgi:hypothetical protein